MSDDNIIIYYIISIDMILVAGYIGVGKFIRYYVRC